MKRLLTATVIFLSSCTAYADYKDTRFCEDITTLNVVYRGLIEQGDATEGELVGRLKKGSTSPVGQMLESVQLASFAETGTTSDRQQQYRRSMYVCLELMLDFKISNEYNTKRKAESFYKHKGW